VLSSASSNSLSKSLILGMGAFMAMALDLPLPAVLTLGLAAQFGVANAVPVTSGRNDDKAEILAPVEAADSDLEARQGRE
jgi:Na+-transporting methylmalonyl-CoA/oxaloacetate decarboxylase beta subunit